MITLVLLVIGLFVILAIAPQIIDMVIEIAAGLIIVAIHLIKWGIIVGIPLFIIFVIIMVNLPG